MKGAERPWVNRIFIVGCPRSGTTLVQTLLGSHSEIYTCRETHFFQRIRRAGKSKVLDYLFLDRAQVAWAYALIQSQNGLLLQHHPDQVRSFGSAAHFFEGLMSSEATARGRSAWLEKTPAHLFYIRLIRRHISSARFVHVLRDGPDVVASLVDAAQKYPQAAAWKRYGDLETAIAEYNRCLRESAKYFGNAGHVFVRYEHVLDDVDRVYHELLARLDLKDEDLCLDLAAIHEKIVRSDERWKSNPDGAIRDTRSVKYEQIFDAEQRRRISKRVATLDQAKETDFL